MSDPSRFERDREAEAKLSQRRVQNVEKHLGLICETVGSITRKSARLRDKGDLLAKHLASYAESDELNPTSHENLLQFAENYAAIQDYHNAKIQRIETKVLKPLTRYGEICRYVKRNIKSEISVCGKEKKVVQKLEKLQDNPTKLAQVELELNKVQGEEQLVGEAMEMEVDKFEREKIMDVKTILTDLVKIEMVYHAKALEYLSRCFENVEQINVEDDFDEFRAAVAKTGSGGNTHRDRGNVSARGKPGDNASTMTSAGSTSGGRSTLTSTSASDTRASTFSSSSGLSMSNRSRLSQRSQSSRRGPQPQPQQRMVQPSPRRASSQSATRQSQQVRISNAAPLEYFIVDGHT